MQVDIARQAEPTFATCSIVELGAEGEVSMGVFGEYPKSARMSSSLTLVDDIGKWKAASELRKEPRAGVVLRFALG